MAATGWWRTALAVLLLALAISAATIAYRAVGDGAPTSADPRTEPTAERPARAPIRQGEVLDTVGVVSYNALHRLRFDKASEDWRRLTRRDDVDLIGWQEAKSQPFRTLYPRFEERGWSTWHYPVPDGPVSLAFSWRRDTFDLLDVGHRRMHRGGYPSQTDSPFPARWVVTAQLRHRASGRAVTLLNTHVNQTIETGQRFEDNLNATRAKRHLRLLAGLWSTTPGDVVVGTGDYNFDYADDAAARPRGGISRRFEGEAVSSYDALGLTGVVPTRNTRWIDYVWLSTESLIRRGGSAQFATHRSLGGYHSDHRPMLARIRLYAD